MNKIKPAILCGGVGTRLWPVSRSASPKQFQRLAQHRGDQDFIHQRPPFMAA